MMKVIAAVVLVVVSGAGAEAGQAAMSGDLARVLTTGDVGDRHRAVRSMLLIPADQRDEAMWVAAAAELQRVAAESHARIDAINAGRSVRSLGEDHAEYDRALVEAVGQWQDPRALPPLISAGGGMLATQPILRFGETAVPLLVEAARTGHSSQRGGVLLALTILLEGYTVQPYNISPAPLSPAARRQIQQLAHDLLQPSAVRLSDLPIAAGLALATGDETLREQIEVLAREPGAVAQLTGLGDGIAIARVQSSIQTKLDRFNR